MRACPRGPARVARLLGLSLLLVVGARAVDAHAGDARSGEPPRDFALVVGCDKYEFRPMRNSLKGCVNDANLIRERFESVLGLAPERTRVLAGWPDDANLRPSRRRILGVLDELTAAANAGDRILIFLAGHGSQQPDANGDEDDGLDEVFLPADVRGTRRRAGIEVIQNSISDDELYDKIRAMLDRGIRVCLFSDSCHSATLARGDDRRTRGIEPEEFGFDMVGSRGAADREVGDHLTHANFVGMYAVHADEKAQELPIAISDDEKRIHGIFSWSLAQALSRTSGEATFEDVYRLVIASYREQGFHQITPFIQGARDMAVMPGEERSSSLFARMEDGRIHVDAGILNGLYHGSTLRVASLDRSKSLGEIRVVQAAMLSSICEPIGDAIPTLEGAARLPVDILSTPAGSGRLRVHVVSEGEPGWMPELRSLDPGGGRITLVDDAGSAEWTAEPVADDPLVWRLVSQEGRRFAVREGLMPETLLGLHRVSLLLRLPSRAAMPEGIEVSILADGAKLEQGDTLRPGSDVSVSAFNATADPRDVWVFWVDADYGVAQVFPDPFETGSTPFLAAASKSTERAREIVPSRIEPILATDGTHGREHFLILAVDPDTSGLEFLETERLKPDTRGEVKGAAAKLFQELAFGPREGDDYVQALGAGTHVAVLSIDMSWSPITAPAALDGTAIRMPSGGRSPASTPADVPDAYAMGPDAVFVADGDVCIVADRPKNPSVLLIDLDAPFLGPDEIAAAVHDRTFGAEIALVFEPDSGRRVAYYDTDADGGPKSHAPRFDLIRVDDDGDGIADTEHLFEQDGDASGGRWRRRVSPLTPWLQAAAIDWLLFAPTDAFGAEEAALSALRKLLDGS